MKVILTGGGTGGHLFPAIAIADSIKKFNPDTKILFVGAEGKIEERLVPENNYEIKTVKIAGLNKKNILKNLLLPVKILSSLKKCKEILSEFKPDVAIGTGGFASAPLIYQCKKMKIPYFLQEGNAYPGKVTKMFSDAAVKVYINFEETAKWLKRKDNLEKMAHPIRSNDVNVEKQKAKEFFGINNVNKVLFVFGGSQGSVAINNALKKIVKKLLENKLNVLWQTGKKSYNEIKSYCEELGENIKVFEFIKEMNIAYYSTDLVVCRSGISSIMELAAHSVPAILVPFPYAAENHQEKNARALESMNACKVLTDNYHVYEKDAI